MARLSVSESVASARAMVGSAFAITKASSVCMNTAPPMMDGTSLPVLISWVPPVRICRRRCPGLKHATADIVSQLSDNIGGVCQMAMAVGDPDLFPASTPELAGYPDIVLWLTPPAVRQADPCHPGLV